MAKVLSLEYSGPPLDQLLLQSKISMCEVICEFCPLSAQKRSSKKSSNAGRYSLQANSINQLPRLCCNSGPFLRAGIFNLLVDVLFAGLRCKVIFSVASRPR